MKKIFQFAFLLFLFTVSSHSQDYTNLISTIEHLTDSMITTAKQPGLTVSITKDGKVIYEKAKGLADINTKEPMDLTMRFRIGCVTKTFTATVILQLVTKISSLHNCLNQNFSLSLYIL